MAGKLIRPDSFGIRLFLLEFVAVNSGADASSGVKWKFWWWQYVEVLLS